MRNALNSPVENPTAETAHVGLGLRPLINGGVS